jgi:DNA-binding transcriptional LysR family regulator
VRADEGAVGGSVRVSTTDTVLHGLLLPALGALMAAHPALRIEVMTRNELANLTQREADIALRATTRPPQHLVGRHLGPIRVAVCAAAAVVRGHAVDPASAPWIAVDDALPEHPSVRWRRRHHPQVVPRLLASSVLSVCEAVAGGLGIGIVPLFMLRGRSAESQLWLLTHPESRHLRRIATAAGPIAAAIDLA